MLDKFYAILEFNLKREFSSYIMKVLQVKGSFFDLIRKAIKKILCENSKHMIDDVKYISEKIYKKFCEKLTRFRCKLFPYFKLLRCCGNYQ